MGLGGISMWQLLIILLIVVLIFGTKKLRNMGGDLGSAVKNFKGAMKDGEAEADKPADTQAQASVEQQGSDSADSAQNAQGTPNTAGKERSGS